MSLTDIDFEFPAVRLAERVHKLIREADKRIDELMQRYPAELGGFVPCDFAWAYAGLTHLTRSGLATGRNFCEWGSGMGVVAMLAHELGWDSCGIEIESILVAEAIDLATRHDCDVVFAEGSFVPSGMETELEQISAELDGGTFWMSTQSDDAYDQLGKESDEFDVIFAFPWPGEGDLIETVFDRSAAVGALLLCFDQYKAMKLQRKIR